MYKLFVNLVVVTAGLISMASVCQAREQHLMVDLTGKPEKKSTWDTISDSVSSGFKKGWSSISKPFESTNAEPEVNDPTRISTPADPSADLHVAVARNLESKNLFGEAEKQFKEALKKSPTHIKAMLAYGRFLDRRGRFAEAVQCYHKAIKAHPKDTRPLNHLSLCLASHGLLDEAASTTEKAIRLEPKRAIHRNNMAVILVETGNYEAAFGHLRQVHDEATSYYNLGHLLMEQGKADAALNHFAMALKRDPKYDDARAWVVHLQKNRPESRPMDTRVARRPGPTNNQQAQRVERPSSNRPMPLAQPQPNTTPPVDTRRWSPPWQSQAPQNTTAPAAEVARRPQPSTLQQPPRAAAPVQQANPLRRGTPWPRPNQATPRPTYHRTTTPASNQNMQPNNEPAKSSTAPRQNSGSTDIRWGSFFQQPRSTPSTEAAPATDSPRPSTKESYGTQNTNVVYPLPPVNPPR